MIYGSGTAPLAHVHFNFLEWLVVKKVGNRLDLLQVDLVLIPTKKKRVKRASSRSLSDSASDEVARLS